VTFDVTLGGRAEAAEEALAALAEGWCVSIVGPPGVGTSAFVRYLEQRWRALGRPTVRVVVEGGEGDELVGRLGEALGLEGGSRTAPERLKALRLKLEGHDAVLLCLDGPGVDDAGGVIASLVEGTSQLKVLVAAKRALGLPVERSLALAPLSAGDAARLVAARLRERGVKVEAVSDALFGAVGGLPLALELLAGRIALLGRAALEVDLAGAVGGSTLDVSIAASVRALSPDEATALERLAVCRSALDAEVVVRLVGGPAPLAIVSALVERSLVHRHPEEGTFRVVEAIAAWVRRSVDPSRLERAQAAHAAIFASATPTRPHQRDALLAVGRRRDDLVAAFQFVLGQLERSSPGADESREQLVELARTLDPVLSTQGPPARHREILLQALRAAPDRPSTTVIDLWLVLGRLEAMHGRHGPAVEAFREALGRAETAEELSRAGWAYAFAAYCQRALGHFEEARASGRRALEVSRRLHELPLVAMAEISLGRLAADEGAIDEAVAAFRRVLSIGTLARAPRLEGLGAGNLGATLLEVERFDEAAPWLARARQGFEAAVDRVHLARVMVDEARLAVGLGTADAGPRLELAAVHAEASGSLEAQLLALEACVRHARANGQVSQAAEALAALEALTAISDDVAWPPRVSRLRAHEAPTLLLTADGRSVSLDGRRLEFSRRGPLRRILVALARNAGRSLSAHDVRGAGWPGERMRPESAAQRVYMAIKRLRELGFTSVLHTVDEGYQLDPRLRIRCSEQALPGGGPPDATAAQPAAGAPGRPRHG
jgi:tetratricopeptide (TPR) repeat protein